MNITQFQALNVVRTYNRQLRVGSFPKDEAQAANSSHTDIVSLSDEAKNKLRDNPAGQAAQSGRVSADSSGAEALPLAQKGFEGAAFQPKLPFS